MSIQLSNYAAIQSNLLIKISTGNTVLEAFSDLTETFTFDGQQYQPLGSLLNISETTEELRAAPKELQITISGVPEDNISDLLTTRYKGSKITVFRVLFDTETQQLLQIAENPAGKFRGYVSNYEIVDELEQGSNNGSLQVTLSCSSEVTVLQNTKNGRRTNPADWTGDDVMSRVFSLAKSNFNFGAEQ